MPDSAPDSSGRNSTSGEASQKADESRMVRPRIMLIDLPASAAERLRREAFSVSTGTMGSRYSASPSTIEPAHFDHRLHALADHDVVVVDASRPPIAQPNYQAITDTERRAVERLTVVGRGQDYFNPRPRVGAEMKRQFDTLVSNGGILIVFCGSEYYETYHSYEFAHGHIRQNSRKHHSTSNLDFLPIRARTSDSGARIDIVVPKANADLEPIGRVLERQKDAFRPESTWFVPSHQQTATILEDRFGESLAILAHVPTEDGASGLVLLLPPTTEPGQLLVSLAYEALPAMRPDMFPDIANAAWMDSRAYTPPLVKELLDEKESLQRELVWRLQDVEKRILAERERYEFLFGVVAPTGTGDKLVDDLRRMFIEFGYNDVTVPDDDRSTGFEEDLLVRSGNLLLVVEAKGLAGCPTDNDCGQVAKYVGRKYVGNKLKEGERAHGLLVVNHERNRPPLERSDPAFTEAQVNDARGTELYSLVTTWQLFRAFQAFEAEELDFEDIDSALRIPGPVSFLPRDWQRIGVVEHVYPKAGAVRLALSAKEVRAGSVLGFIQDARYVRVVVESVRIDQETVQVGRPGERVGVKVSDLPPEGTEIYLQTYDSD